jgi:hypothetical protein
MAQIRVTRELAARPSLQWHQQELSFVSTAISTGIQACSKDALFD